MRHPLSYKALSDKLKVNMFLDNFHICLIWTDKTEKKQNNKG
jgi:hypothetical protein